MSYRHERDGRGKFALGAIIMIVVVIMFLCDIASFMPATPVP